ncbi:MAG: efflux RND transporter periplasmic adaptor subunit [Acidobacteria bacterium]|nr:efflux RND transporter periplasmic adaptor subunit [Acidobacteriota bacterium]
MRITDTRSFTATIALTATLLTAACMAAPVPEQPFDTEGTQPEGTVPISEEDLEMANIETAVARSVSRAEPLAAPGVVTFDERRTARVGSLVEGIVEELPFQVGDTVSRGTVLAQLHSHVVHDAWADYFKGQADRRRLTTELSYATTAEARAAALVADKALSPQELERARADLNAVTQEVAAAEAEITRTEQELEHYGITPAPDADPHANESVPVVAPLGGVVVERVTSQGAAVTPGSPLLVVSDLSRVWVLAEIDEALLGRVVPGSAATIQTAAYPGESFAGTLTAVGDVVNTTTRRVGLRVEIDNPGRRLKPQMFVSVSLGAGAQRSMIVVPSKAVQTMEGETVVFRQTPANTFVRQSVTTGLDIDGDVEIISGLKQDDVVATAGAFLLKSELLGPAGEEP